MAERPDIENGVTTATEVAAARVILGTIGDTTWRMFVPSIGCTLLGVWLDSVFGLKPWLMFAGVILGFVGAYLLVNKQLGRVKRKKERKNI